MCAHVVPLWFATRRDLFVGFDSKPGGESPPLRPSAPWLPALATGFSLLELLVVMGMIGIVSLSTIPLIKLAQTQAIRATSYQIAAQMERVKQRAMATQRAAQWAPGRIPVPLTLTPQKSVTFSETGFPVVGSSGTWTLSAPMARSKKIVISSAGRIRVE